MKTKLCRFTLTALAAVALSGLTQAQQTGQVIELDAYVVKAMEDFASRAIENETPVSFSTVDTEQMQFELGSRDLPMVLETTPSVYASQDGGGAGDSRVNVRGFNQRNVAVMINGIPVNDMENGWVYWSNWDGVGDAAQSIQVQRGMSNVNLATPAIGGTLNIITDPASFQRGGSFKQEFGTNNFLKTTLVAHSGLINDTFAISGAIVRKTGDGLVDGAYTDAWAYYVGATWKINEMNRLDFTALGAPQRHGQNSYDHNVAEYDQGYAKKIGVDPGAFDVFTEHGREWNENWSYVDPNYDAKQYYDEGSHERELGNIVNERENYFHKPIVALNWDLRPTEDFDLYTSVYWSGGVGGGSGTYGSSRNWIRYDESNPYFNTGIDFQANIEANQARESGESLAILRNSVNNQSTLGVISKASYTINDEFSFEVGVDWRTAEIDHFREVRDLLGGDYYLEDNKYNDFWENDSGTTRVGLGDKIGYYNTNTVDWLGAYAQGAYDTEELNVFGMVGWTTVEYGLTDHFGSTTGGPDGDEFKVDADAVDGYQFKLGGRYKVTEEYSVYATTGYFSKVPIFDGVIDDSTYVLNEDPQNEKFSSIEAGVNYQNKEATLAVNASVYYTKWEDRTVSRNIIDADGNDAQYTISGLNQRHMGTEFEITYIPMKELRFDATLSLNDWIYSDDVNARYVSDLGSGEYEDYHLYLKDLKVGDAPQKQFTLQTNYHPFETLSINLVSKWNGDHYADFSPDSRTSADDRGQSWKTPSYWVFDLHVNWDFVVETPWASLDATYFIHVFNLFDEIYVQDADDNDKYNSYHYSQYLPMDHSANDAGVFLGLPRYWNTGIRIRF